MIETFTVVHDLNNIPTHAIVFCRLSSNGYRCIAWVRSGIIDHISSIADGAMDVRVLRTILVDDYHTIYYMIMY